MTLKSPNWKKQQIQCCSLFVLHLQCLHLFGKTLSTQHSIFTIGQPTCQPYWSRSPMHGFWRNENMLNIHPVMHWDPHPARRNRQRLHPKLSHWMPWRVRCKSWCDSEQLEHVGDSMVIPSGLFWYMYPEYVQRLLLWIWKLWIQRILPLGDGIVANRWKLGGFSYNCPYQQIFF